MIITIRACNMCYTVHGRQTVATKPRITVLGLDYGRLDIDLCDACYGMVTGSLVKLRADDIREGTGWSPDDVESVEEEPEEDDPTPDEATEDVTPRTTPESVMAEIEAKRGRHD